MGCVYKVQDQELDKVIALKLIRAEQAQDRVVIQRFKQELLLARNVTHKNVVRLYDFGEANGFKFFTMEWIDGQNLKELIRRKGKLSAEESIPILQQMLGALQEAHRQGVIHRNLKPQNVMIDAEGDPHIMDFGIARAADTNTMTATGSVMGTPDYMSPEQAYGEKADQQSDLFSLGVMCFEMLTGELPYQAESPLSRAIMRLTTKPKTPRELNADLPPYLEKVTLKCMEVDKELRYRSAGEVLRDLEREQVDTAVGKRVRRAFRRRKGILAVAAGLILAVGATLTFFGDPPTPSPPAPERESPLTTLAILPFANATGSDELDWMRTGLPEMLFTDISQSRFLRPVPGERMIKLLRELGVEDMSRFDEAILDAISELAPAQAVLYGQFVEAKGRIRLDLALRDSASGVPTPIKAEKESNQVFALVDEITRQIKGQLDLTPEQLKGDTDQPVAELSTSSIGALRAYQGGVSQIRQGANQAAIPFLQKAVAEDPDFAMGHARLAEAYLKIGEHQQAKAEIDRAQSLSEISALPLAERYHVHAIAALAKEDYETAVNSHRELAKLYPQDPDIQLSLAQSLEELGRNDDALEAYRRVLELAPGYGAALLGLGRAQVMGGQPAEAVRSLEQALETRQFEADLEAMGMIHSILGVAFRDTEQLDEAIEHLALSLDFRKQTGNKRGQSATLSNLAAVYEYRSQIDEALQAEREAISLAREIGDRAVESMALLNMGLTYQTAGDLDRALESLRASMRIEMERQDYIELPVRLEAIATLYLIRGQYDDALVYLEQARGYVESSGDQQGKAYNLVSIGLVKMAQGRYEEAIEVLLAALPIFQEIQEPAGVATAQIRLAQIYMVQGRYGDAHRTLRKCQEIHQEFEFGRELAETTAEWALFLAAVGQFGEAEKELEQAKKIAEITKAEDMAPLLSLVQARLRRLQGNLDDAASACRKADVLAERYSQKEISIGSRIELGRIHMQWDELAKAEKLLKQTREEATDANLPVLEAEATAALAQVYLAQKDAEAARRTARLAIRLAEEFDGRPLLCEAHATLGIANHELGRSDEALACHAKVEETLSWMVDNLNQEHVESFMHRSDVQVLLETMRAAFERSGGQMGFLEKWIEEKPSDSAGK